jgi:hypothetical protein
LTLNKYGPDIESDSLFNFMASNKKIPFLFIINTIGPRPWSPTPDDTAFAIGIQVSLILLFILL